MQVMEAAIGTMVIWTEAMIATEIKWKTAAMTATYVASTTIYDCDDRDFDREGAHREGNYSVSLGDGSLR